MEDVYYGQAKDVKLIGQRRILQQPIHMNSLRRGPSAAKRIRRLFITVRARRTKNPSPVGRLSQRTPEARAGGNQPEPDFAPARNGPQPHCVRAPQS